jgi:hypothetical protein
MAQRRSAFAGLGRVIPCAPPIGMPPQLVGPDGHDRTDVPDLRVPLRNRYESPRLGPNPKNLRGGAAVWRVGKRIAALDLAI